MFGRTLPFLSASGCLSAAPPPSTTLNHPSRPTPQHITEEEEALIERFMNPNAAETRTLADIIMDRIKEHDGASTSMGGRAAPAMELEEGERPVPRGMDPKAVEVCANPSALRYPSHCVRCGCVLELVSYSFRAISLGVRAEPLRCSRVHTLRANGCRKAPLRLSTKDPL